MGLGNLQKTPFMFNCDF